MWLRPTEQESRPEFVKACSSDSYRERRGRLRSPNLGLVGLRYAKHEPGDDPRVSSAGGLLLDFAAGQVVQFMVRELSVRAIRSPAPSVLRPRVTPGRPRLRVLAPPDSFTRTKVVSETPGRVRLEILDLRGNPARVVAIEETLVNHWGVRDARANALTGRVLVEFDPARISLDEIRAALEPAEPVVRPLPFPRPFEVPEARHHRVARLVNC